MNNDNKIDKRNKILKLKQINSQSYEHNINIRKKATSILDSQLKSSFTNLNTLLDKINNVKDLVVFNKYDVNDLKSVKNLDNNALLFSRNMKRELKKSSKLLYAYNLDSLDLDNFLNDLEDKSKNISRNYKLNKKKYKKKDNFNKLKKEFDLANTGKTKHDKMLNKIFLKNESKMRDLYNLKLELFFNEQRKKIGANQYYEEVKKPPFCIREKDKRANQQNSKIQSKYYDIYKLSQSFEIEEGIREQNILNEEDKIEEEKENNEKNKKSQKNFHIIKYNNKDNKSYNTKYFEKVKPNANKNSIIRNNMLLNYNEEAKNNKRNNINFIKKKKPVSASMIQNDRYKNYKNYLESSSINNNSQRNIKTYKISQSQNIKNSINYRPNSGNTFQQNNSNNFNSTYHKIFQNNLTTKNKRSQSILSNVSKQTHYSNTISSRPLSSFSNINNNNTSIYHFLKKNKKRFLLSKSLNSSTPSISKYKKRSYFTNYINQINKIIKYSNYSTHKFKEASRILKNKKLFQKSNSQIFEKTSSLDIEKINDNLKLNKNRHSFINDKKLIFNNSKKVKLMLTSKNRKILNTILMELIDKQRRVNGFYNDLTHFEKMMQKFKNDKKYRKLANETMNYEKRFDKETILELFKQDEEKIMEYLKEMNDKDKYDEEEWKHILLKHKNMKILESTDIKKKTMSGNLHKKHLVSKFKKEK